MRVFMLGVLLASSAFGIVASFTIPSRSISTPLGMSSCGCDEAILSGKPSVVAKTIDPRRAIRTKTLYNINGESTSMDEILGTPKAQQDPAVVVFLRSLG